MKLVALPEITVITMGQSPPSSSYNSNGEGLPFFQGKTDFGDIYPTARAFCTEPNKIAEPNDILMSVRAPVGSTNLNRVRSCIGRGLAYIRCSSKTDLYYLFYFLRFYESEIINFSRGSTFDSISRDDLDRIRVPLPPIAEQKRIAAICAKADRLRRTRRYALELSDTYLRSVFMEMFGDPVINPKRWELLTLENICSEIYRYPTFYGFDYSYTGVPVARIGNILQNGCLDSKLSNYVFVEPQISSRFPRTILEFHDIVMAVRGDGSTVERIGLVNSKSLIGANISPNLLRFKADREKVHPLYLFSFMNSRSGQKLLIRYITRTAKKTVTAENLKTAEIPIPPLPLQEKFAAIVQKSNRIRAQQREALRQAEHLFQTILHRAFRGEL